MKEPVYYSYFHDPHRETLWFAFGIALTLHLLLILGVGFDWIKSKQLSSGIEVTLVHHRTDTPQKDAEHLAQFDQMAGGEKQQQDKLTTDEISPLDDKQLRDTSAVAPPPSIEEQSLNPTKNDIVSLAGQSATDNQEKPLDGQDIKTAPLPTKISAINSLRARLEAQKIAYSKIPRTRVLTGISAKAANEAQYFWEWINWVEKVGNANYPVEARNKQIYGNLRMAVSINRDGSIENISVLQSSGHLILDQAAKRILRLATPFAPIPDSIPEDRLEIIRTWRFIQGNQFDSLEEK